MSLPSLDAKEVIKEALQSNGDLDKMRAELRASVFKLIEGSSKLPKEKQPPENILINELIREYLAFNGLIHSLSVFSAEAQLPRVPVPRNIVSDELGLPGAPSQVPLLYSLIEEGKEIKKIRVEMQRQRGKKSRIVDGDGARKNIRAECEPKEKTIERDAEENEWESFDDEDDNIVDERFDDVEEEIIDEDEEEQKAEGADEDYESIRNEITDQLKHVSFEVEDKKDGRMVWRNDKSKTSEEKEMQLEYSNKGYDSFFQLRTEYPCLSFDILQDEEGANRTKYPLTMYLACGSQADESNKNQLYIMKLNNICRTKHDVKSDEEDEESLIGEDESDSEDEEKTEINNGEPIVEYRTIPHHGTANRIRLAQGGSTGPHLCAVWSDRGHVQVFNIESEFQSMSNFTSWNKKQIKNRDEKKKKSCFLFCSPDSSHQTEGYGLDWSSLTPGAFASGDCAGNLFTWLPHESCWTVGGSFTSGGYSIEEIKWSATQNNVLICGRAGGVVEVWDTRDMIKPKLQWTADATDINVLDWNKARQASHLLVTGADSGNVAIWDLRNVMPSVTSGGVPEPLQHLKWQMGSITSLEFSYHNESVLSVTSDDGQCTLWDLSLERDVDEEKEAVGELFQHENLADLPDQLMFQHQGLVHPKEAHFHRQIPGLVITTDFNGLHIFKPMNWKSLMS